MGRQFKKSFVNQLKKEIEFLDENKKINLIQQAKEWSESLREMT